MNPEQIFYVVVTAILCGAAAMIAPVLAYFWYAARKAEQDAVLKKTMLDRGMTTDEIVKVLTAGPSADKLATRTLTDVLINNSYDSDDIAAITAAVDDCPAGDRDEVRRAAVRMAEAWYDGPDIVKFVTDRAASAGRRVPESAYPA